MSHEWTNGTNIWNTIKRRANNLHKIMSKTFICFVSLVYRFSLVFLPKKMFYQFQHFRSVGKLC